MALALKTPTNVSTLNIRKNKKRDPGNEARETAFKRRLSFARSNSGLRLVSMINLFFPRDELIGELCIQVICYFSGNKKNMTTPAYVNTKSYI